MLVEGQDSEVVRIPVLKPELNTVRRTATLALAPDGVLQGTYVEKRFGDLSESRRRMYSEDDAKQQGASLNKALSQDLVSFTVTDVKVENANAFNQDLTTSFHLSADRYSRTMGSLLMVRPRVIGTEPLEADRRPRSFPVDLKQTMQEQDDYTIELPDGYVADELPEPVKLDVGFASYESSTELKGNALHYTRTYTVRDVTVPAERYADVQKLAETIGNDEQNRAVLKKK